MNLSLRPAHLTTCRYVRLGRSLALPFRTPLNGLDKKQGARWKHPSALPGGKVGTTTEAGRFTSWQPPSSLPLLGDGHGGDGGYAEPADGLVASPLS